MKINYNIRKTNKKDKIEFVLGLLLIIMIIYFVKVVF
nr:MAG TPA: phosphoprotein [Caudoviricetes sp.]